MSVNKPICPTGCSSILPIVDFDLCDPKVFFGEIETIYLAAGDSDPFTDWEDDAEWNSRLSNSNTADKNAIRALNVTADLAAATSDEVVISVGRKVMSPATHTLNIDLDEIGEDNYEFARSTSCNTLFRTWFATKNHIYGGNDGVMANLNLRPIIERGQKSVNKISGTLTWEGTFSAERIDVMPISEPVVVPPTVDSWEFQIFADTDPYDVNDGIINVFWLKGTIGKSINIDWGDYSSETVSLTASTNLHHIYSHSGVYDVVVTGDYREIQTLFCMGFNIVTTFGELPATITYLSLRNVDTITGNISDMVNMIYLYARNCNGGINFDISPNMSVLETLSIRDISDGDGGSINNLPQSIKTFNVINCQIVFTGELGLLPMSMENIILQDYPNITNLIAHDWGNFFNIELTGMNLASSDVDNILVSCDEGGWTDGQANLLNNSVPTITGLNAKTSLEGKSWTVMVDS